LEFYIDGIVRLRAYLAFFRQFGSEMSYIWHFSAKKSWQPCAVV